MERLSLLAICPTITMGIAPKVISPILLCLHTTSEADVGSMPVGAESSHQNSITCCCYVTEDSRGVDR